MSPTTLHTCLQGPLSARKPHRSQRPCGSGLQGTPLLPLSRGHPFNPLTHRLVSGTCPNTPLPQVTGMRVRRRQEDGGEDRKVAENARTYLNAGSIMPGRARIVLSVLQKARLKAADGPCWGHPRLPQAAPPILTSQLLTQPPTARPTDPPSPRSSTPRWGHPAHAQPRGLPACPRPAYLCRCWAAARAARWCWGPPGRIRASALTPRRPPAWGGHRLSRTEQTGGGSRVFRQPRALTGAMPGSRGRGAAHFTHPHPPHGRGN